MIRLCDYGCGQEALYRFKNGKWCCSKSQNSCPIIRKKFSERHSGEKHHYYGIRRSNKTKNKISKSNIGKTRSQKVKDKYRELMINRWKCESSCFRTDEYINIQRINAKKQWKNKEIRELMISNISKSLKFTISKIKKRYPLFSKIEEMRYNPNKPGEKEIQVHCKNHNCQNSKEQSGWFTSTYIQLYERIRGIEKTGNDGGYFYCSEKCKQECPLYGLKSDPFKDNMNSSYTENEYQTFRTFVLKRDNYICQYCGKKAEHVHHERPQKLEPFFALDPDLAWSCCKKCHYKYGHKDECSTGNLAKIICQPKEIKYDKNIFNS